MNLDCTIVFEKNWEAIHAKNPDGSNKYRYIINTGSSRSSKTYSLIDCYDNYAWGNSDKRLTVWRSTKKDCKDTVMSDFVRRLKTTDRYSAKNFNKTESINHYSNGSQVEFRGVDEESAMGLTQDAAWFNEPYSISKDVFDQIDQRTSDFIFIDWNPKEDHWIDTLSKHPRALVLHSTFMDNPFCPVEQKIKILSYEPLPLEQKHLVSLPVNKVPKQYRNAWNNETNKTADKFKWDVYGLGIKGEVEGKIFSNYEIIPEVPKTALLYGYGMDFGFTNDPTTLIAMYQHKDGVLLHELIYSTGLKNIPLSELMRENGVRNSELIVADCADPKTIDELFDLGFSNIHPCVKGADSVRYGISVMKERPIYITASSTNMIREFDNYKNQKNKFGKYINEPEKNQDDHAIDAARYIITDKYSKGDFFVM